MSKVTVTTTPDTDDATAPGDDAVDVAAAD